MKKFSVSAFAAITVSTAILAFSSVQASAETVTLDLKNVSSTTADGGHVYPYNFSIDGSTSLTSLMCISFNDEVTVGESWTATVETVAYMDSLYHTSDYAEEAWLFSNAAANPSEVVADQEAAWYLLDPTFGDGNGDNSQLTAAKNFVDGSTTNPTSDPGFYAGFDVYVPVSGSQPWGDGTPQTFIGDPPLAPTPEPSSLLMLGTGLLACAGLIYRRARTNSPVLSVGA